MARYIILLTIIIFSGNLHIYSQIKSYTVSDGLSNSTVKAICQDNLEYIWIGTKNGLNRFDGYQFKTYYHTSSNTLTQPNDIVSITKDNDGLLWIGTFSGVVLMNPLTEKFINIEDRYTDGELPKGVVVGLWIDKNDDVWVATKVGLYFLQKDKCISIDSFSGAYINSMAACGNECLLLDIPEKGVVKYNTRNGDYSYLEGKTLQNRPLIYKIFMDNNGIAWLGADLMHIYKYIPESEEIKKIKILPPNNISSTNSQIHDIIQYNDSTLLLATDNGLYTFNTNNYSCHNPFISEQYKKDINNERIMTVYKDNQNSLWIGTFNSGIRFYNPKQYLFNHYTINTYSDNKPARVVGELIEHNNKLYIGHDNGISTLDMDSKEVAFDDLQKSTAHYGNRHEVFYMFKSGEDNILLYLFNKGIYSLNLTTKRLKREITDIPATAQVRAITKDKNKRLWIAEDELSCYDPLTGNINRNFSTNEDKTTQFMLTQDIMSLSNGNILVGTRTSGVLEFNNQKDSPNNYFKGSSIGYEYFKNKNISILFEDTQHILWIGTYDEGLYKFDRIKDKITHYNIDNGLGHNSICGIIDDEKATNIWVSTTTGLSSINKQTGKVINYTRKNGFPLTEISRKSFLLGTNGNIYVGGSNGIVEFSPKELVQQIDNVPDVKVSLIESLNSKYSNQHAIFDNAIALSDVKLSYNNSSIIIKFSVLDYLFTESYRYAYKLDGMDNEWNYIERNDAIYSNLPHGKYVFKVKACNNNGIWSDTETEIPITIHPPFWLSIWAKLIYIALAITFGILIFRYIYDKKTAKYRRRIDEIEKENIERNYKMRIELFTQFSHELRTPLTLITGPSEDILNDKTLPQKFVYPLRQINKNSNRLLLLVNQLMDFRKLEHGSMKLSINRVNVAVFLIEQIDSFSELLNKKDISISLTNDYYHDNLYIDIGLMEKVVFNLISNAIKHSKAGDKIFVTSTAKNEKLLISVRDNGNGIAKENINRIFDPFFQVHQGNKDEMFGSGIGLNFVRYAINLHRGKIWVESAIGKGSEFFIELNLGRKYLNDVNAFFENEGDRVDKKYHIEKKSIIPITNEEKYSESAQDDNKMLILVADDDDDMRNYIVSILNKFYTVIEAVNGEEAISLTRERIPDLVVCDVMMPVMNGIEYCMTLKDDINIAHIPVILLTARILNEHIQEGYEAMADDYITKPFNSQILKIKIESIIKNRQKLKEAFERKLLASDVPMDELVENDPFLERLIELIKNKIQKTDLTIEELYAEIGLSRAQFFRKMKTISDISPNKLILNIRIKMAIDLLKTKQYSVSEVAYQVGFTDPSYFTKVFKNIHKITPTEFLKRNN